MESGFSPKGGLEIELFDLFLGLIVGSEIFKDPEGVFLGKALVDLLEGDGFKGAFGKGPVSKGLYGSANGLIVIVDGGRM